MNADKTQLHESIATAEWDAVMARGAAKGIASYVLHHSGRIASPAETRQMEAHAVESRWTERYCTALLSRPESPADIAARARTISRMARGLTRLQGVLRGLRLAVTREQMIRMGL